MEHADKLVESMPRWIEIMMIWGMPGALMLIIVGILGCCILFWLILCWLFLGKWGLD